MTSENTSQVVGKNGPWIIVRLPTKFSLETLLPREGNLFQAIDLVIMGFSPNCVHLFKDEIMRFSG